MLDIEIKIKRGSLTLRPSADDHLHVDSTPELVPELRGSTVVIDAEHISGPVTATIFVPVPVGQIDANVGRGPCQISSLSVLSGDVNVALGNLTMKDCLGKWDINLGKGDAHLEALNGVLDINLGMGKLQLVRVSGTADINNGLGTVQAEHCEGGFDINAGKGDIHWSDAAGGTLEMNAGLGTIQVHRGFGKKLELNAGLGKVSVVESDWDQAIIETGMGDVSASGRLRHLEITAKQRGTIQVSLPLDLGARVEASTDRGRIISHLNLIPVGHAGPQRGQRLVGVVGDGSGQVTLQTRRGDVVLSQGSVSDNETYRDGDSDMAQEDQRVLILQRLADGALNVDEAEALLESLDPF